MSDEIEVREILYRYARAADEQRWGELADLFAEQGTWLADGYGSATGRAAVVKLIRDLEESVPPQIHLVSNVIAEIQGDRAKLSSYLLVVRVPCEPYAAGKYEGELVKRSGRWLFDRLRYIPAEGLLSATAA